MYTHTILSAKWKVIKAVDSLLGKLDRNEFVDVSEAKATFFFLFFRKKPKREKGGGGI